LVLGVLVPQAVLTGRAQIVSVAVAPFVAGLLAVALAFVAVARTRGEERVWRLLLACALVVVLAGALEGVRVFSERGHIQGPSAADAAHLLTPVFALLGLLAMPVEPAPGRSSARPLGEEVPRSGRNAVIAIDSLLIVDSMLLIAWVALLREVTASGISGLPFLLALAYPLGGTVVVVAFLLRLTFYRPRNGRALALLAVGLLAMAVTASADVYLTLAGTADINQTASPWIGLTVGPTLIALAMLVPPRSGRRSGRVRSAHGEAAALWVHVYLPYLPFGVAAVLVVGLAVRGEALRGVTLQLAVVLAALVTLRQVITTAQNTRLLIGLRTAQKRLHHMALHDPLTGLANRVLFTSDVNQAVERYRSANEPVVLLFGDLDGFKDINDTLGHNAGDEVLRAVAGRLRGAVRDEDLVARLGGDEFAVLLPDPGRDPRATGDATVRRIQESMRHPFRVQGSDVRVGISMGLALTDADADAHTRTGCAEDLMHRADQAMYTAKDHSRRARASARG
jgi:diguanylate cyclase (GGDEF)-like protein